jgi:signal peptidase I
MVRAKIRSARREYIEAIVVALIIAVILRTFVVQAYHIPTESMQNTLLVGDYLLVDKFTYHYREPAPGDVIVFEYPLNPNKDYVKRCVAIEGQVVEIRDKVLYIDGVEETPAPSITYADTKILPSNLSNRDNFAPLRVPPGHVFVLGDNRDNSRDSRVWGFLDKELIKGRGLGIYWSWTPDPNAPKWESPYIFPLFSIVFYNVTHFNSRIRWDRLGNGL